MLLLAITEKLIYHVEHVNPKIYGILFLACTKKNKEPSCCQICLKYLIDQLVNSKALAKKGKYK